MNVEEIRVYCIAKPDVEEGFPFGPETLVFKANGKIFLLMSLDEAPLQFNVKCNPERAVELREQHSCILPGYHMNKQHWNTIFIDGSVNDKLIKEWINHSYDLVVKSLTKKQQQELL